MTSFAHQTPAPDGNFGQPAGAGRASGSRFRAVGDPARAHARGGAASGNRPPAARRQRRYRCLGRLRPRALSARRSEVRRHQADLVSGGVHRGRECRARAARGGVAAVSGQGHRGLGDLRHPGPHRRGPARRGLCRQRPGAGADDRERHRPLRRGGGAARQLRRSRRHRWLGPGYRTLSGAAARKARVRHPRRRARAPAGAARSRRGRAHDARARRRARRQAGRSRRGDRCSQPAFRGRCRDPELWV